MSAVRMTKQFECMCRLEFLLARNMVCTGLSMLDFKVQVKHSMQDLLTKYGKQATALPLQPTAPKGATLDRQHKSKSRSMTQHKQQGRGRGSFSREDVPLGLKATRVAHAAAVSSRVFSPSMPSPLSGQLQPDALPSQQELDDTLGFVQHQGSFHSHSERAVQHLMTDQPPQDGAFRRLSKHTSLPSQRSVSPQEPADSHHPQDSAYSYQHQISLPRLSQQADASDSQSYRSKSSAHPDGSKSQHSQQLSAQRPQLGNRQMIASSALFHTAPLSQRNGYAHTDHLQHPDQLSHGLSLAAAAQHRSYGDHPHSDHLDQQSHGFRHHLPSGSATAVDRVDRHLSGRHSQHSQHSPEPAHSRHLPTATPAALRLGSGVQSSDSFNSNMSSDNNETAQWDNHVLAHIQEGSEPASLSQHRAQGFDHTPHNTLQSADSFGSNALSTDMTETQQWGKSMLSELHLPEEQEEHEVQASSSKGSQHGRPALHAVLQSVEAEGMHPPTSQTEPGPHDWLWLPDELSTINDSDLSSLDGSRPDIHSWLAQQQASRLPKQPQQAQHDGHLKFEDQLQQAPSPTTPLHTEDSLDSTFGDQPRAASSLPWADNALPFDTSPRLHSETPYDRPVSLSPSPAAPSDKPPPQPAAYSSPFARWSSTSILGSNSTPPEQPADPPSEPQHSLQQQQQQQSAVFEEPELLQERAFSLAQADAKQQELEGRLAALDTLDILGEAEVFQGFGSPLQTRQAFSPRAQPDSFSSQLYNTAAPLPVDAPCACLSAPEEALVSSMQEIMHGRSSSPCMCAVNLCCEPLCWPLRRNTAWWNVCVVCVKSVWHLSTLHGV